MEHIPFSLLISLVFVFGVVIGSFLNVVIYRLHTSKSLNDRSHCLSCGKGLAWYELFPLLSYLLLRGRCSGCGARIPSRYFLVELATGCAFVMVFVHAGGNIVLSVLLAAVMALLIVGTVYDFYHMIIPDEVVVGVTATAALYLVVTHWPLQAAEISKLVLAGTLASLAYGFLWWYSGGRWIGFGDVKLAFPLGLLVGLSGVFTLVVLSFWVGAILSIIFLGNQYLKHRYRKLDSDMRKKRLAAMSAHYPKQSVEKYPRYFTMKSEIPFAPFMVAAFVLTLFMGFDVLDITTYVIEALY